jgi:hypothetical protein
MDSLKQWALALSAAMVAAGLCRMLMPSGSMEKMFRTAVSVFFLCCLLSPFVLELPSLAIQPEDTSGAEIEERVRRLEDAVHSQTEDAARWELAKLVGEKLAELGINYYDVTITMEQNGQSGALPTAAITLDPVRERDHRAIKAALERELGFAVRLEYTREGTA